MVVLPDTDIEGARIIAQSIQKELLYCQIIHEESEVSQFVTVSMGIDCQIPITGAAPKPMISNADEALYQAKQQGRDRYCIYSLPVH